MGSADNANIADIVTTAIAAPVTLNRYENKQPY
jgi:hypothetical protein